MKDTHRNGPASCCSIGKNARSRKGKASTATSQHRDAVFLVLEYLTSEEFQDWQARVRANVTILADGQKVMQNFAQEFATYKGKNLKAYSPPGYSAAIPPDVNESLSAKELRLAFPEAISKTDINTALRQAGERRTKHWPVCPSNPRIRRETVALILMGYFCASHERSSAFLFPRKSAHWICGEGM